MSHNKSINSLADAFKVAGVVPKVNRQGLTLDDCEKKGIYKKVTPKDVTLKLNNENNGLGISNDTTTTR